MADLYNYKLFIDLMVYAIEIERTAVVSAETGETVDIESPVLHRMIDALSF